MPFQDKNDQIEWKVHFTSTIQRVYEFLTTDDGRAKFWAESTQEQNGIIKFSILNYPEYDAGVIEKVENKLFRLEYFGTEVKFELYETPEGTDLKLTALISNEDQKYEMTAGWVSVLMAMKAAVDFNVDLRNHHPQRVWENGYLDN